MKNTAALALVKASSQEDEGKKRELLDTRKRTILGDFAYPWSSSRAGRAWALADSTGQETPARLRYPQSMAMVDTLGGGLLGGGIGALIGTLDSDGKDMGESVGLGAAGGGLAGALAGIVYNIARRRKGMRDINEGAEGQEKEMRELKPYGIGNLLLPIAGPHRLGYTEVMQDLAKGEVSSRGGRHAGNTAALLGGQIPIAGLPIQLAHGVASNLTAHDRDKDLTRLSDRERLGKAASFEPDNPGQTGAGTPGGNSLFSSYSTPDWLNKADNWVNQLNPESFIQNQLGFENYENPEWLNTAGRWFGGLSPEMKAGMGVGVPLAGLALMKLLRGGDRR